MTSQIFGWSSKAKSTVVSWKSTFCYAKTRLLVKTHVLLRNAWFCLIDQCFHWTSMLLLSQPNVMLRKPKFCVLDRCPAAKKLIFVSYISFAMKTTFQLGEPVFWWSQNSTRLVWLSWLAAGWLPVWLAQLVGELWRGLDGYGVFGKPSLYLFLNIC